MVNVSRLSQSSVRFGRERVHGLRGHKEYTVYGLYRATALRISSDRETVQCLYTR